MPVKYFITIPGLLRSSKTSAVKSNTGAIHAVKSML